MAATTQTIHLIDCPACSKSIKLYVAYDMHLDRIDSTSVAVPLGTMTGVRVHHDCPPPTLHRGGIVSPAFVNPLTRKDHPMSDLTPEKLAELRRRAESATPFVRFGGADPATVYVLASDVLALLDAAAERDALAAAVERVRAVLAWIDTAEVTRAVALDRIVRALGESEADK